MIGNHPYLRWVYRSERLGRGAFPTNVVLVWYYQQRHHWHGAHAVYFAAMPCLGSATNHLRQLPYTLTCQSFAALNRYLDSLDSL